MLQAGSAVLEHAVVVFTVKENDWSTKDLKSFSLSYRTEIADMDDA